MTARNPFRAGDKGEERTGFFSHLKNIWAAVVHDHTMDIERLHLNEFKVISGATIMLAGLIELSPLTVVGGAIPEIEALHELDEAGHQWILKHPHDYKNHNPFAP